MHTMPSQIFQKWPLEYISAMDDVIFYFQSDEIGPLNQSRDQSLIFSDWSILAFGQIFMEIFFIGLDRGVADLFYGIPINSLKICPFDFSTKLNIQVVIYHFCVNSYHHQRFCVTKTGITDNTFRPIEALACLGAW